MRTLIWLGIFALGACSAGVVVWQRQQAAQLRAEIAPLKTKASELAAVEAEHRRLLAAEVPLADRERLRADHAALEKLRAELSAIKAHRAAR